MDKILKVKRLNAYAKLPKRAAKGAAGYDLSAATERDIVIKKGERVLIPTGIAIELPLESLAAFVFARSGLAAKFGITLSNSVGVIDSDYRGEIKVGLINLGESDFIVKNGERIAQMVIMPVEVLPIIETEAVNETERGAGGFGSTGR